MRTEQTTGEAMPTAGQVRIEHVALWVRQLEPMREFYVTVLGGRSGPRYENPRTGFTSYFIAFGEGCRIELMHRPALATPPPGAATGYAHVAFSLGERQAVDAAVDRPRRRGVTVESPPRVTGDGYYEAVVMDPEGNRIELTAGAGGEAA